MTVSSPPSPVLPSVPPKRRRNLVLVIFAVCAAPVIASYLAYYLLPPSGRTNYGTLVEPQRPLPSLALVDLDGHPVDPASWRGRWVMVQVDPSACDDACKRKLWNMRQLRLTTGRERDRVLRAWLVTDAAPIDGGLLQAYDGTQVLRADPAALAPLFGAADPRGAIWIVDPNGNLMLEWPADGDPQRMKRDLNRLLQASSIG